MDKDIERYIPDPSESLAIAAVLCGMICPPLAPAAGTAAGVVKYLESRQEQKRKKINDDAARTLQKAYERNKKSGHELSEPEVDLFFELVELCLRDDDEAKRELFYDPVIAWLVEGNQKPLLVRQLAIALSSLSAIELFAFVMEYKTNIGIREYLMPCYDAPRHASTYETFARSRLTSAGLANSGGIWNHGNGTPLAGLLVRILDTDGFNEQIYSERLNLKTASGSLLM